VRSLLGQTEREWRTVATAKVIRQARAQQVRHTATTQVGIDEHQIC